MEKLEDSNKTTESVALSNNATDWCTDADDWGDGNANIGDEENGNLINTEIMSDEDEESCSLEDLIRVGFGNLNFDDKNANSGLETQGKFIITFLQQEHFSI